MHVTIVPFLGTDKTEMNKLVKELSLIANIISYSYERNTTMSPVLSDYNLYMHVSCENDSLVTDAIYKIFKDVLYSNYDVKVSL